jgi:hypothetical protein
MIGELSGPPPVVGSFDESDGMVECPQARAKHLRVSLERGSFRQRPRLLNLLDQMNVV